MSFEKNLSDRERGRVMNLLRDLKTKDFEVMYRPDISTPADGSSKESELPLCYLYLEEAGTDAKSTVKYYLAVNRQYVESRLRKILNRYDANFHNVCMDIMVTVGVAAKEACDKAIVTSGMMPSELWPNITNIGFKP